MTGSVAAIRTPALFDALCASRARSARGGDAARRFTFSIRPSSAGPTQEPADVTTDGPLFRDSDEWPGTRYHRGDEVLHIEFRKWADLFLVAPLDANTLAKFALGISDNFLSCVFRAWDFAKPVILAPAMNTLMWDSPVTLRHLRQLLEDRAGAADPFGLDARTMLPPFSPGMRRDHSGPAASQATRLRRCRRRRDGRGHRNRRGGPAVGRANGRLKRPAGNLFDRR